MFTGDTIGNVLLATAGQEFTGMTRQLFNEKLFIHHFIHIISRAGFRQHGIDGATKADVHHKENMLALYVVQSFTDKNMGDIRGSSPVVGQRIGGNDITFAKRLVKYAMTGKKNE